MGEKPVLESPLFGSPSLNDFPLGSVVDGSGQVREGVGAGVAIPHMLFTFLHTSKRVVAQVPECI